MTIKVRSDQEIIGVATQLLLGHLPPSQLARLWSAWHLGDGDYVAMREQIFEGETVTSLVEKIRVYEEVTSHSESG